MAYSGETPITYLRENRAWWILGKPHYDYFGRQECTRHPYDTRLCTLRMQYSHTGPVYSIQYALHRTSGHVLLLYTVNLYSGSWHNYWQPCDNKRSKIIGIFGTRIDLKYMKAALTRVLVFSFRISQQEDVCSSLLISILKQVLDDKDESVRECALKNLSLVITRVFNDHKTSEVWLNYLVEFIMHG